MKKNICIIIPYYNGSQYIERALRSVYNQTITPDEVIVVDDGSSESESQSLVALTEKYSFMLIKKENGGQGSARNLGVFSANSEYICFLDQDDYFYPWHIEILLNAIPSDDPCFGFAYGDVAEADGDGSIIRMSMIKDYSSHPKTNLFDLIGRDMFILPSASIISRIAFENVRGFDEQFTGYEDDDLFLRIFRGGFTNYFIDKSVTVWCIHEGSTSYSIKMSRSRWRYFNKLKDNLKIVRRSPLIFRDLLIPRFGPLIFHDALKSKVCNQLEFLELYSYFFDFTKSIFKDRDVSYEMKFQYFIRLVLLNLPRRIFFIFRYRCVD